MQFAMRHCTLAVGRFTLSERQSKHSVRHITLHLRRGTLAPAYFTLAARQSKRAAWHGKHEMRHVTLAIGGASVPRDVSCLP